MVYTGLVVPPNIVINPRLYDKVRTIPTRILSRLNGGG